MGKMFTHNSIKSKVKICEFNKYEKVIEIGQTVHYLLHFLTIRGHISYHGALYIDAY